MSTPPPGASRRPGRGKALLLAALLAATTPAVAEVAPPRELPPAAEVGGARLVLNGSALRTVWGFEVYRIGLFLASPVADADAILRTDRNPKRVHIIMLRSVSADQFTGTVQESIDRNFSPAEKELFAAELSQFLGFFHGGSDLRPGSEVVLDFDPARGMVASVDGREAGAIPGPDFYHAILRLWLAKPLQASIREGLLGQAGR
jgi:hypothetical protein